MNEGRETIGPGSEWEQQPLTAFLACEAKPGRGCGVNHLKRISYTEVIRVWGLEWGREGGTHTIPGSRVLYYVGWTHRPEVKCAV